MKKFAELTSEDPDLSNLQLYFWRMAICEYTKLEKRSSGGMGEVNDFIESSAIILTLTGASLTQLVGQNCGGSESHIPSLSKMLKTELGESTPLFVRANELIKTYDDIRHFGKSKHNGVKALSEKVLVEYMNTAQEIWQHFLTKRGSKISDEFKTTFQFDGN